MQASQRKRVLQGMVAALVTGAIVTGTAPVTAAGYGVPIEDAAASMGILGDVPELKLGRGVARPLETKNDAELCAAGAIVVDAPIDALADSFRDLSLLRSGGMVVASGRISESASLADFAGLAIPAADLDAIKRAKRGDSDVKLSAEEIDRVRGAGAERASDAFKQALLERVVAFRERGIEGLGSYNDKKATVSQDSVTRALLASLDATRPTGAFSPVESFEYWSVEQFGGLKQFVTVTNMTIKRREGAVRIETVQLYASHYCEGLVTSIDLYALPETDGARTLLRLTFRTQVDALGGLLGGLKRKVGRARMVEQLAAGLERLRTEAPRAIQLARK